MFYKTTNDNKVLYNDDGELIYYIPQKYFDINVAQIHGEYVNSIGIFSYGIIKSSGVEKIKPFKCPTMMQCKPSLITKEKELLLDGEQEPSDYVLLHFYKNDELISNTKIPTNIDNVDMFNNLLIRANLPNNIPYDEIHEYIIENARLNKFNYKVNNQIMGILISVLCRDNKDPSKIYRYTDMKDNYKSISILQVPKYTSAYTAITSENADEAIAAALVNKSTIESPLEKAMMD